MHLVFLTPSDEPAGGGSAFNAGLVPGLRALGHLVDVQHGVAMLPHGAIPVVDGLLLPDLEPQLDTLLAHDAIAIIHHVSAKAGRDRAARDAVRDVERRVLPRLRRVLATSVPVQERLQAEFGLAAVQVLDPGLPDLRRSEGSGGPGCRILSLGVLTPRKGHDRLLRALVRLLDLDWTLTIAGDARRDPVHAAAIAALVDDLGLGARVTVCPDPSHEALAPLWHTANLFALASSWEGYPAALAESLRRGVPVVATRVGGVEALVPQAAGILCPPDDPATFGKCLRRAIFDAPLRASLAEAAWTAGQALPGWPQQALAFETLLRS